MVVVSVRNSASCKILTKVISLRISAARKLPEANPLLRVITVETLITDLVRLCVTYFGGIQPYMQ